jgi:hypothetical protein
VRDGSKNSGCVTVEGVGVLDTKGIYLCRRHTDPAKLTAHF